MRQVERAKVFRNGRSQAVRIPAQYRFKSDEVFIQRDDRTGVVSISERPFPMPIQEIFCRLDEAGAADFETERDRSLPREVDLF